MGCCNKDNNKNNTNTTSARDYPEGIDGCCRVRGQRCFCLPYDDPWMVTAQVLSIVAVLVSWIWWPCFLVSITLMTLLQIAWCCRQNKGTLLVSAVVAILAALAQIGIGVYLLVMWKDYVECYVFALYAWKDDDDYYDRRHEDDCHEEAWATVSFVCAVFWVGTASCILRFVFGGRHAKWEEKHGGSSAGSVRAAVEENNNNNNNNNNTNNDVVGAAIPVATAEPEPAAVVAVANDDDKLDEAA